MIVIIGRTAMIAAVGVMLSTSAHSAGVASAENSAYRLTAEVAGGNVRVTLDDRLLGLRVADGPYLYRAQRANDRVQEQGLNDSEVSTRGDHLTIRGRLADLDLEQTFTLPRDRPIMEEHITLSNGTRSAIHLAKLEAGFQRQVADHSGRVLSRTRH